MNHAHESHWTPNPDPKIEHVLKGWAENGVPSEHYLDLDEMLIRNVTTDIRDGMGGRIKDDNSIFIFEVAGLCVSAISVTCIMNHRTSNMH